MASKVSKRCSSRGSSLTAARALEVDATGSSSAMTVSKELVEGPAGLDRWAMARGSIAEGAALDELDEAATLAAGGALGGAAGFLPTARGLNMMLEGGADVEE